MMQPFNFPEPCYRWGRSKQKVLQLENMVETLELILQGDFEKIPFPTFDLSAGLCTNVLTRLDGNFTHAERIEFKNYLFKTWEGFSGDLFYPCGDKETYYTTLLNCESQYDSKTEQGKGRLSLAKHCKERIEFLLIELKQAQYNEK